MTRIGRPTEMHASTMTLRFLWNRDISTHIPVPQRRILTDVVTTDRNSLNGRNTIQASVNTKWGGRNTDACSYNELRRYRTTSSVYSIDVVVIMETSLHISHQIGAVSFRLLFHTIELTNCTRHEREDQSIKKQVPEFHACACHGRGIRATTKPMQAKTENKG